TRRYREAARCRELRRLRGGARQELFVSGLGPGCRVFHKLCGARLAPSIRRPGEDELGPTERVLQSELRGSPEAEARFRALGRAQPSAAWSGFRGPFGRGELSRSLTRCTRGQKPGQIEPEQYQRGRARG